MRGRLGLRSARIRGPFGEVGPLYVDLLPPSSLVTFDKRYKSAFSKLASSMGKEELRQRRAQMPTPKAIDCRKYFGAPLEL